MKHTTKIIAGYIKNNKSTFVLCMVAYIVMAALAMLPAKLLQLVIDEAFMKYNLKLLYWYIFLLALSYTVKNLLTFYANKGFILLANGLLKDIKSMIYNRLMQMDISFFTNNEVGVINSRVEEINAIDNLFSTNTLSLFSSVIEFLFAVIVLFSMNWKLLLILSIPIPFLLAGSIIMSKKIGQQLKESMDSSAEYMGKIQSSISGMEAVKSQNLEKIEQNKLNDYNKTALDKQKKQSNTLNNFSVSMSSVSFILTTVIYLVGGIFFINHNLTMGTFIAISTYAGKLYSPILGYIGTSLLIQPAIISLQRVATFFFGEDIEQEQRTQLYKAANFEYISFDSVSFSYDKNNKVLENFSYQIKQGERYQITGKNGSGKTTLIRILLKLLKPTGGKVLIDGYDLATIPKDSWVEKISYVSQRNYLFNMSIRDNITYGLDSIDESRLSEIINDLNLYEIENRILSEHGDKTIGENASRLSGGERQKISIARALLLNRSIFIFDEAMASLDSDSAKILRNIIRQSNSTWIIIDHQYDYTDYGFKKIVL